MGSKLAVPLSNLVSSIVKTLVFAVANIFISHSLHAVSRNIHNLTRNTRDNLTTGLRDVSSSLF